jgi:hypothetical protein
MVIDRGRATRSTQNQAAYRRKHGRRGPTSARINVESPAHAIPDIFSNLPSHLVSLALLALPNTYLFREALRSADNLDESDLAQWDSDPPYPASPDTPLEAAFTEKLVDVMHGRRLRELRIQKEKRKRDRLDAGSQIEVQRNIAREIGVALKKWHNLSDLLETYQAGPREMRMSQHRLQWHARLIHSLYEELEDLENHV